MSKIILTVSELNQASQKILENHFPSVWVEGEISNLTRPTSGHFYFSLKDPKAQIRCALFRHKSLSLSFEPRNGLLVQVLAKVSLYPDRGDYQLIIDRMEMAGDGLLKKAYEELVNKLAKEGLFEEQRKKHIPRLPRHIGVITSPTGAAIRDILSVLKRRFPSIPITIYPTKVQGVEAAPEIIRALFIANQQATVDVLILARGGGSLEDLWPFNEESVARAIFESHLPIVTGIGHEIDFTIADFVADHRAPTPSAAAELVTPDQARLIQQFSQFENRLIHEITKCLQHRMQQLDWLLKRLRHPGHLIQLQIQRLNTLNTRLKRVILQLLKEKDIRFKALLRALDAVSPLATLHRGYAIVSLQSNKKIIHSVQMLNTNDSLAIQFSDGLIAAKVI
jgi:exodeoxyribonuclease VII large subunit